VVKRIRQHVNPLHIQFSEFRGAMPAVDGRAIEVEIGCAEAQFLFELADKDPSRLYVGLEIREDLVDWVNREAAKRQTPVHAVFCQAQLHMPLIFDDASVERVYLNFPDPWFKVRHRKRRMIDRVLAEQVHRVVKPGGEVLIQSDVWEVALDALEVFERLDHLFENRAGEWSFWRGGNPYGVRSWREQHCEEDGLPIWRAWYRRLP
jgi:tRNA (guanine-N7-)-methyltransferase